MAESEAYHESGDCFSHESRTAETMPIYDWTRVTAGVFHDFHQEWIPRIKGDHIVRMSLLRRTVAAAEPVRIGAGINVVLARVGPCPKDVRRGSGVV
jgi:hypothetical protein